MKKYDFRDHYQKGDWIYYLHISDVTNKVSILNLKVSTLYPNIMIAYEDRGMSYCIDSKDKDKIFETESGAEEYLKEIQDE